MKAKCKLTLSSCNNVNSQPFLREQMCQYYTQPIFFPYHGKVPVPYTVPTVTTSTICTVCCMLYAVCCMLYAVCCVPVCS